MGWLSRLFCTCGVVRFERATYSGEMVRGKTEIECFNVSRKELEENLKEALYVETGKRIKTLTVTGFYKT